MTDTREMTHRIEALAASLVVGAETADKARRAVAWRVERGKLTVVEAREVLSMLGLT